MRWSVLAVVPIALLIFFGRYAIDVPVGDHWTLVPLLEKSYAGELKISDLWAQHNEHRPFFPRLILLSLARMSSWNHHFEIILNLVTGFGIFIILAVRARHVLGSETRPSSNLLILMLSMIVFSLAQSENWFWPWQFQFWLGTLTAVSAILLLTSLESTSYRFCGAVVLAIVSSLSFAAGFCIWPVGLFIVRRDKLRMLIWLVSGSVLTVLYLYGYQRPVSDAPFIAINPGSLLLYFFSVLGSPLLAFMKRLHTVVAAFGVSLPLSEAVELLVPALAGFAGVLILFYMIRDLLRRPDLNSSQAPVCMWLAGYSILNAVALTIGRARFGLRTALDLRYITLTQFLWIAAVAFLVERFNRRRSWRTFLGIVLIAVCVAANSTYGALYVIKEHRLYSIAKQELFRLQNDEQLKQLYFDPDEVRKAVPFLREHRLSVFRNDR